MFGATQCALVVQLVGQVPAEPSQTYGAHAGSLPGYPEPMARQEPRKPLTSQRSQPPLQAFSQQ